MPVFFEIDDSLVAPTGETGGSDMPHLDQLTERLPWT